MVVEIRDQNRSQRKKWMSGTIKSVHLSTGIQTTNPETDIGYTGRRLVKLEIKGKRRYSL